MLRSWKSGDHAAPQDLVPVVYAELRHMPDSYLRRERPGHTLHATALIHEGYMRLAMQRGVEWQSRSHFFRCRGAPDAADSDRSRPRTTCRQTRGRWREGAA